MSQRRARRDRQDALAPRPEFMYVINTAKRMLNTELGDVPLTRTNQFIVGWMRAAFAQSLAIATLSAAGAGAMASPNRRSLAEIVVRLQWLRGLRSADRPGSIDQMLEDEKAETRKAFANLEALGYSSPVDLSDLDAVLTNPNVEGRLKDEAKKFMSAARANGVQSVGLYYMWREETQYTHATGALAGAYAPGVAKGIGSGAPPTVDQDLASHPYIMMLVLTLAFQLLEDEGVDRAISTKLLDAYFGD